MKMRRIIALFGPPGVGKSTLVKLAQNNGIKSYDLEEEVDDLENRKSKLNQILQSETSNLIIIGSADLGPKDYPKGVETILLLPPKNIYLRRSRIRDEKHTNKRGQKTEMMYDLSVGWKNHFDRIIDEVGTAEEILEKILSE
jgi:adenylate kinase family enzyme